MNYDSLRHFADSWGLLLLAAIFVILLVWLFRRGSTKEYERAARIPMDAPEHPEKDTGNGSPTKSDAPRQEGDKT